MNLAALQLEDLPHYTYDDYAQWEGRWEIIKGIPYSMVPAPVIRHQEISLKISVQLYRLLETCNKCKVLPPVDWQITEDTVVQPDILVVCGYNKDASKLLIPPVLVFEILSPSTGRKDRVIKFQLYREAGVKYYCIVDPETKSVDIFELQGSKYRETEDFKEGEIMFDLGPCTIAFDFGRIFRGK